MTSPCSAALLITLRTARLEVRTRFAPAPTGHLHVGGARTALFNWLLARRFGGSLILRIDDTDLRRSTEESFQGILDTLRWLGLEWDEGPEARGDCGPYRQSERFELYTAAAEELEAAGYAYRCYCTSEELADRRQLTSGGSAGGYDGRCRELDAPPTGRSDYVLRFAVPIEGELKVSDAIRGDVVFDLSTIEDFVIQRGDRTPTFSLAGAYDDWAMSITHVVRGEDLLPVTPRQILLSRAFGRSEDPIFAHLPLIVGADRAPLSKRHGDVAVRWYRDAGFLPEALVNYLALLGWGPEGESEIIPLAELVEQFELESVSRTPAMFDLKKLDWMNNHYIQTLALESAVERALPFLQSQGLVEEPPSDAEMDLIVRALPLVQVRIDRLSEVPAMIGFLLRTPEIDSKAWFKAMSHEWAHGILTSMLEALRGIEEWKSEVIGEVLKSVAAEAGVKPRLAFGPLRIAVSGVLVGPPLFESLEILGCELVSDRVQTALSLLEAHGPELPDGRWPLGTG